MNDSKFQPSFDKVWLDQSALRKARRFLPTIRAVEWTAFDVVSVSCLASSSAHLPVN